jgi:hypothetical protein
LWGGACGGATLLQCEKGKIAYGLISPTQRAQIPEFGSQKKKKKKS